MNYINKCRLWLEVIEGLERYIKMKIENIDEDIYYNKEEKEVLLDCYEDILSTLEAVLKNDID